MYIYQATLERVIDGDTIDILCDLGFNVSHRVRVRLANIDTAELTGTTIKIGTNLEDERRIARQAKEYVEMILKNKTFFVRTIKDKTEKYGRYLAVITVDNVDLNNSLVALGFAKIFMSE